ncbi:MAG: outer membrane lipid asymmetry maintenance protein MlaD [Endozoicomonadaceae bacterium]|nr:outer membrane lipid asymmetry maintenance protein MlaD [Endozoicomonadaceae bacterium]
MQMRTMEIGVGAFILAGVFALVLLALKVSGLAPSGDLQTYELYAEFDNIGSLSQRAKVSLAGVTVGRVVGIDLNKKTYMARVTMEIDNDISNIPVDSSVAIESMSLLGEKYVGISIGGSSEFLLPGEPFDDTQSAIVLENLIGKFMMNSVSADDAASDDSF